MTSQIRFLGVPHTAQYTSASATGARSLADHLSIVSLCSNPDQWVSVAGTVHEPTTEPPVSGSRNYSRDQRYIVVSVPPCRMM
ncbi:hypothetical protein RR46_05016 [Papilio xuthus]|uniref:Uncharacterized protein n=1 Tax=Papilio xuthus TaxID=66420 RepID=A0A194PU01_PAPXU|nr:hypothetical protein RR46_05016 [Papilio xuthus]